MALPIYSTGDGAFLAEVLNAVAMLMNNGGFAIIAAIGLLLGVLIAVATAVTNAGKSIPLAGPALALVAYMVLFVPKADVLVYDSYSMSVRPVDNIPLGVAVSGNVLSSMGRYITEQFEQAYSIPGMTSSGYATPLEMLLAVRRHGLGPANSLGDEDNFLQTMANYLNDCTETGILRGDLNPAAMAKNADAWAVIEYPSQAYTTKTHLVGDGADGEFATCSEAYQKIDDKWEDRLSAWNDYLSGQYGGQNVKSSIDSSLNTLIAGVGANANEYMRNSLIMNIVKRVSNSNYSPDTFGATMMVTQATNQAQIQFAAEASMFAQFARPLMTFVEGFVYGIVPFMVFVIGFGMAGFKLISRYIFILFWVQLWMPIMSLTNLFVQMSFKNEMDALNSGVSGGAGATNPMSLLGLAQLQGEASNWIAVAGNLVAATPALALTIVYGGAYTLVNLAGRLNPQDTIDETQLAPDMLKNDGILSMQARAANTALGGTTVSGADKVAGSFSIGEMASQAQSSTFEARQQAQQQYAHAVTKGWGVGTSGGMSLSNVRSIGHDLNHTSGKAWRDTNSALGQFIDSHDLSQAQTETMTGVSAQIAAAGGSVSGGIKFDKNGMPMSASGQVSASLKQEWRATTQAAAAAGITDMQGLKEVFAASYSKESHDALTETLAHSAKQQGNDSYEIMARNANDEQYSSALSKLTSTSEAYQQADSFSQSVGVDKKIGKVELTEAMKNNGVIDQLEPWLSTHTSLQGKISDRVDQMTSQDTPIYGDEAVEANMDRYRLHAATEVLGKNLDDADSRKMFMNMMQGSGYFAMGSGMSEAYSPSRNAGIGGGVQANAGRMVEVANAHTNQAEGIASSADQRIEQANQMQDPILTEGQMRRKMTDVEDRRNQKYNHNSEDPTREVRPRALNPLVEKLAVNPETNKNQREIGAAELSHAMAPEEGTARDVEGLKSYIAERKQQALNEGMTPAQANFQEFAFKAQNAGYLSTDSDSIGSVPKQYTEDIMKEGASFEARADLQRSRYGYGSEKGHLDYGKPYYEAIKADYMEQLGGDEEAASKAALNTMNMILTNTAIGKRGVEMSANRLSPINDIHISGR